MDDYESLIMPYQYDASLSLQGYISALNDLKVNYNHELDNKNDYKHLCDRLCGLIFKEIDLIQFAQEETYSDWIKNSKTSKTVVPLKPVK